MASKFVNYYRAHDYAFLMKRWRKIARESGLRIKKFSTVSGYNLHYLESSRKDPTRPAIYISAGIHGDEAGGTEGLVTWAEQNAQKFSAMNVLIFPCLNPWGLVSNVRCDEERRDLNRSYHDNTIPFVVDHKRILADRKFDLVLMLHEDYDAQGAYIYEIKDSASGWGSAMLEAGRRFVSVDARQRIEGRAARRGLVWRKITPDLMPTWPEAFQLYFHHSKRVFTIETPSEFQIDSRVKAQCAMISKAIEFCCQDFRKTASIRSRASA